MSANIYIFNPIKKIALFQTFLVSAWSNVQTNRVVFIFIFKFCLKAETPLT